MCTVLFPCTAQVFTEFDGSVRRRPELGCIWAMRVGRPSQLGWPGARIVVPGWARSARRPWDVCTVLCKGSVLCRARLSRGPVVFL